MIAGSFSGILCVFGLVAQKHGCGFVAICSIVTVDILYYTTYNIEDETILV